jgi:hypothetical protein
VSRGFTRTQSSLPPQSSSWTSLAKISLALPFSSGGTESSRSRITESGLSSAAAFLTILSLLPGT